MSKKNVNRVIWCSHCHADSSAGGSPQLHTIEYQGITYENGKQMAKFKATCHRCEARKLNKDDDVSTPHTVSVASYNALIAKEIYSSATAP